MAKAAAFAAVWRSFGSIELSPQALVVASHSPLCLAHHRLAPKVTQATNAEQALNCCSWTSRGATMRC